MVEPISGLPAGAHANPDRHQLEVVVPPPWAGHGKGPKHNKHKWKDDYRGN